VTPLLKKNGIQVIARAADILRSLENQPEGLSLGELASRVQLPRSTIQRIVGALVHEQLLITAGGRSGVMLGPALVRLAATANIETDRLARPVMQELSRELEETVDLSVLQGRTAFFVDQVLGTSRLIAVSAVGEAFPLHCTANGKALLGCVGADRRRLLLAGKLRRHTPATIMDMDEIERQVAQFGKTQLCFDLEEHSEGICAVGTSFIDPLGRDFALSVPMPAARFKNKKSLVGKRLLDARAQLLQRIPGSKPPSSE
jgi:DNA-binding IclR family transcriptional regulator